MGPRLEKSCGDARPGERLLTRVLSADHNRAIQLTHVLIGGIMGVRNQLRKVREVMVHKRIGLECSQVAAHEALQPKSPELRTSKVPFMGAIYQVGRFQAGGFEGLLPPCSQETCRPFGSPIPHHLYVLQDGSDSGFTRRSRRQAREHRQRNETQGVHPMGRGVRPEQESTLG